MPDLLTAPELVLRTWQHMWLQAHDLEDTPRTRQVRRELAGFWARLDAWRHLAGERTRDAAHPAGAATDPAELFDQIRRRAAVPSSGPVVPALVPSGRPDLRIERSRPGWRLDGKATVLGVPAGASQVATFAIDEGDNEVLVIVPMDAPGTRVGQAAGTEVVFTEVELSDRQVTTGLHELALLQDQVAVLLMTRALAAAGTLIGPARWSRDLDLAHASLRAAVAARGQRQLTCRSTAVSSAVSCVMPVCRSIGQAHEGSDPAVRLIFAADDYLCPPWHLTRLAALL